VLKTLVLEKYSSPSQSFALLIIQDYQFLNDGDKRLTSVGVRGSDPTFVAGAEPNFDKREGISGYEVNVENVKR
jgi:hypothetical protein